MSTWEHIKGPLFTKRNGLTHTENTLAEAGVFCVYIGFTRIELFA